MTSLNSTPIVDLFAGPGGLGEGFASFNNGHAFEIIISAEKDPAAHQTLKLRAFFRNLKKWGGAGLCDYYKFCNGESNFPYSSLTQQAWNEAGLEAQILTLGSEDDDIKLAEVIEEHGLNGTVPWVLIGGPPCQAYSLVGRARNRGKLDYSAAKDHRHYLYREYLKVIQKHRPAVFVMENVKGILSSSVNGERIFKTILQDLSDPDEAVLGVSGSGYRIYSLVMQKLRNKCITRIRFVVERTFGGQALWFGGKNLRYVGVDKAHAWHVLQAMAYNLKRLPVLWVRRNFPLKQIQCA